MTKYVYIIMADGFEEIEALATCDILRRGGVEVSLAGIEDKVIKGSHGIAVTADCLIEDIDAAVADMIVFPGGTVGVENIGSCEIAMDAMKEAYHAGKYVAAICAGPTLLGELGILDGKKAVCYPGLEDKLTGAEVKRESGVVKDGMVITARAAGSSIDFGLELLRVLKGDEIAEKVRKAICY